MDPTLKTRTLDAIKERIAGFSPQLRTAAKYVVDHPSDFGLDPIRDTAQKAQVSTYTFVKLSKSLGFSSFEALRQPFRNALVNSSARAGAAGWPDLEPHGSEGQSVYREAAENAMSIVARSLERQSAAELEAVADLLTQSRKVYLTGVRSSYAVAYYLHYVGRMALPSLQLIPHHINSAIDDLNTADRRDTLIAITVTPYSRETIEACAFAKSRGVRLILITDSEVVSPDLVPEHTLVASVLSAHYFGCFSGMMALVELLIAALMERGGTEARARIKSYEALRKEHNAYWVAQKKH